MRDLAQTNLQLYEQLMELSWEPADLAGVRQAYELACELFSGRYRPSGKTFVAHVVGTASCVAAVEGRVDLVKAAMLHAAYEQGDFGLRDRRERRRAVVRSAIGTDAEAIVSTYTALPWSPASIEDLREHLSDQTALIRDVLVVRLANEVDEHLDGGARVADRSGGPLYRDDVVDAITELAVELGHPHLADLLERVRSQGDEPSIPGELRSTLSASVLRPPASYRPAFRRSGHSAWRRLRRELGRIPGARALYRRIAGATRI